MKAQRGGPGRGQGRKPIKAGEKTVSISFRGTEAQRERFKALGGGKWVRDLLGSAKCQKEKDGLAGERAKAIEAWNTRQDAREIEQLRSALVALISGDVGRQTLAKLATGQGTDTDDGRAWLRADEMVTPNAEIVRLDASGGQSERMES